MQASEIIIDIWKVGINKQLLSNLPNETLFGVINACQQELKDRLHHTDSLNKVMDALVEGEWERNYII